MIFTLSGVDLWVRYIYYTPIFAFYSFWTAFNDFSIFPRIFFMLCRSLVRLTILRQHTMTYHNSIASRPDYCDRDGRPPSDPPDRCSARQAVRSSVGLFDFAADKRPSRVGCRLLRCDAISGLTASNGQHTAALR